jgi:transcriptional regulator with XRE-family HTH domain
MKSTEMTLIAEARDAVETGRAAELRKAARLSQPEVARAARISEAAIYRYEARKRVPHGSAAVRYARVLRRLAEIVEARAA